MNDCSNLRGSFPADLRVSAVSGFPGRTWSQALRLINTRAAALVAAWDNMTMAQLNFKTGIATKSKERICENGTTTDDMK